MDSVPYLALISALAGLGLAVFYFRNVKAAPPGTDRMVTIMTEIQKGSRAFLAQQYRWVAGFVVVMAVLIPAVTGVALSFVSYLMGAALSAGGRVRGG